MERSDILKTMDFRKVFQKSILVFYFKNIFVVDTCISKIVLYLILQPFKPSN